MEELRATALTYPDDDRGAASEEVTGVYRTRRVPTLGYVQHTVDGRFVRPETVRLTGPSDGFDPSRRRETDTED